jgi:hypothetical protein
MAQVDNPAMYCGNVVTLHVWTPTGSDALWFRALSQLNGSQWSTGPSSVTRGGWTTFSYTIPDTGPFGIQQFGVQFGLSAADGGAASFTGNAYIDAIAW